MRKLPNDRLKKALGQEDKSLKPGEQIFVKRILEGSTGKQAAIDAGYPPQSASIMACKVKNRPHVKAILNASKDEAASRLKINIEWSLKHLKDVADINAARFEDKYGNERQVDSKC